MAIKPADVRFYVDADTLGLARILVNLRSDVTFPGDPGGVVHKRERPSCPVTQVATPDAEWIREVAERDWLIITRDRQIASRTIERTAIEDSGGRMIAVSSRETLNNWSILEIVMSQWRWIEKRLAEPGPFIYAVTRTSQKRLL